MATLLKDAAGVPVPQYFNSSTGSYEQLEGSDGASKVQVVNGSIQISGSNLAISSAPVTGRKTVTSVAAEIFAGASRKSGRSKLILRNTSDSLAIKIGSSDLTDTNGFSIEPGAMIELDMNPLADVPIYAISSAGNVEVEVMEI